MIQKDFDRKYDINLQEKPHDGNGKYGDVYFGEFDLYICAVYIYKIEKKKPFNDVKIKWHTTQSKPQKYWYESYDMIRLLVFIRMCAIFIYFQEKNSIYWINICAVLKCY